MINSTNPVLNQITALVMFAMLAGSCSICKPTTQNEPLLEQRELVEFQSLPNLGGGIPFSIGYNADGKSAETLHYFLTNDGDGVVTRYLGPGGPTLIGFSIQTIEDANGYALICNIRGSDYSPTLARWTHGESGRAENVHIRTVPILEWREVSTDSEAQDSATTSVIQWRPISSGLKNGTGEWRQ